MGDELYKTELANLQELFDCGFILEGEYENRLEILKEKYLPNIPNTQNTENKEDSTKLEDGQDVEEEFEVMDCFSPYLWYKVFKHCDGISLFNISQTTRLFYRLLREDCVWNKNKKLMWRTLADRKWELKIASPLENIEEAKEGEAENWEDDDNCLVIKMVAKKN